MSTEVITTAEYQAVALKAAADKINTTIDLIASHEEAFEESTLEPRLIIGLEIAKAQETFGMSPTERASAGGDAKAALSRRDKAETEYANPLGFAAWIGQNIPRLNRTTAYKYATAFRSLGISTADATPIEIRERVKSMRHHSGKNNLPAPSLTTLYKAGKPSSKEPLKITAPDAARADKSTSQIRLETARVDWTIWRERGEKLVHNGVLENLDKKGLEELKEFQGWLRDRLNARLTGL